MCLSCWELKGRTFTTISQLWPNSPLRLHNDSLTFFVLFHLLSLVAWRALELLPKYAALFEQTFAQGQRSCVCGVLGAQAQSRPPDVSAQVRRFFEANLVFLTRVISGEQSVGFIRLRPEAGVLLGVFFCALKGAMVLG